MNRKRVLVVDDDKGMLKIIEARLLHSGFEVELAQSGGQAIEILKKRLPGVILLDIVMPEMDGFETLSKMKADRKIRSVPVIMLTSKSESEDVQRAMSMGAKDYIVKPFNPAILMDKIRKTTGVK